MDALLGAYRASARIVFRDLSAECAHLGMGMSVVIDLGESIWAYIDELSSVSAQAYAEAQSAQAGVLELHRAALATALVRGGTEEKEVQRLAALADWRLPRRLAVVVLPADAGVAVRERLGRAGLVVERDSEVVAVIDAIRRGVPPGLEELTQLGRTLHRRRDDVLAYFDRPSTSNGPTEAINGRLEHLRGSALGFRNLTNYIARSLLETGGFRPRLHPGFG